MGAVWEEATTRSRMVKPLNETHNGKISSTEGECSRQGRGRSGGERGRARDLAENQRRPLPIWIGVRGEIAPAARTSARTGANAAVQPPRCTRCIRTLAKNGETAKGLKASLAVVKPRCSPCGAALESPAGVQPDAEGKLLGRRCRAGRGSGSVAEQQAAHSIRAVGQSASGLQPPSRATTGGCHTVLPPAARERSSGA